MAFLEKRFNPLTMFSEFVPLDDTDKTCNFRLYSLENLQQMPNAAKFLKPVDCQVLTPTETDYAGFVSEVVNDDDVKISN